MGRSSLPFPPETLSFATFEPLVPVMLTRDLFFLEIYPSLFVAWPSFEFPSSLDAQDSFR